MLMPPQAASLLAPGDAAPAETLNESSAHPLALVCEHAGQAIPKTLGDLGVSRAVLDSHIGWDIGAAALTRQLAARLGAPAVLQPFSRLVIDCNRPPEAPDAVPVVSDGVVVPGNSGAARRDARVAEIFEPFHAEVARVVAHPSRQAIVAIHSFTPEMNGVARPWQIGLLYRCDAQTAGRLAAMLSARRPMLLIGMNQPYAIDDMSDWFVPQHGERTGLPHCLIEIRNDLVADETGQADWAEILASVLDEFVEGMA